MLYTSGSTGKPKGVVHTTAGSRPYTRNPNSGTRNPKPGPRIPNPESRNPKPETRTPNPETRNPKPETLNYAPETRTSKSQTTAGPAPVPLCNPPKPFRGGLVFKAHRLVYHSTLGLRGIKKKKKPSIYFRKTADSVPLS